MEPPNEYTDPEAAEPGTFPATERVLPPTQPGQQYQHSVPMCLSCGTVTPWQVGPLYQPINLIIGLVFLIAWGGGLIYLLVVGIRRSDPNNREKVCPFCKAKNMWTFVYSDGGAQRPPVYRPAIQLPQPNSLAATGNLNTPPAQLYPVAANGITILALGIASFLCIIMGPVAWYIGNQSLKSIDAGQANPAERQNVAVGRICGMVATGFGALVIIIAFISSAIQALRG
jgi:hypothetical protein